MCQEKEPLRKCWLAAALLSWAGGQRGQRQLCSLGHQLHHSWICAPGRFGDAWCQICCWALLEHISWRTLLGPCPPLCVRTGCASSLCRHMCPSHVCAPCVPPDIRVHPSMARLALQPWSPTGWQGARNTLDSEVPHAVCPRAVPPHAPISWGCRVPSGHQRSRSPKSSLPSPL